MLKFCAVCLCMCGGIFGVCMCCLFVISSCFCAYPESFYTDDSIGIIALQSRIWKIFILFFLIISPTLRKVSISYKLYSEKKVKFHVLNHTILSLKQKKKINLLFFFKFYFIFKLYITVLVLPNIKMNPPQAHMRSPPRTLNYMLIKII